MGFFLFFSLKHSGVDLDEKAIAQAKANSLLNKLDFIQYVSILCYQFRWTNFLEGGSMLIHSPTLECFEDKINYLAW